MPTSHLKRSLKNLKSALVSVFVCVCVCAQEESRAVGGLEEQLTQLQETLSSLQRGLHTLEGLADTRGAARVQEQSFIMVLPQSSYFP